MHAVIFMHLFFHQQMAAAQGDGWAETDAMLCILLLHCRRAAHGATLHHWRWRGLLTDYLAVQGAPAGSTRPAILLCHGFGAFSGERAGISAGLPWRGVLCLLLSRLGSVFLCHRIGAFSLAGTMKVGWFSLLSCLGRVFSDTALAAS